MQFFTKYFELHKQETMDNGEYSVCCPFEHKDHQGNSYKEINPSAHINPESSVFHCKVCAKGYSEAVFITKMEGISYKNALILLTEMDNAKTDEWLEKMINLKNSPVKMQWLASLGIDSVIDDLQLGFSGEGVDFPVFVYGDLLDVRNYTPTRDPKVKSNSKAKNLIIPFDLWREDSRDTLLCAGEKDMAIARAKGFNAISFTGGEMSFPKLFKHSFKGRKIYITYDNDQAGRDGALKSALLLKEAGADPHIVLAHYLVCAEKGEDIHDFFMKYGKSAEDLQDMLNASDPVGQQELSKAKEATHPMLSLEDSTQGQFVNKRYVRSHVNVVSVFEDIHIVPDYVTAVKYSQGENCTFERGHEWEWVLDEQNIQDILYLMDSNITEDKRNLALRKFMGIPSKEPFVRVAIKSQINVWKCVVTDTMETNMEDMRATELLVFSPEVRMEAGKKYVLTHKTTTHPLAGQKVVTIAQHIEDMDSDLMLFKATAPIRESLKVFQLAVGESVNDKMDELHERAKGFIGVEARQSVTWATDMYFHTPLEFKLGRRKERAYLDAMIVGDPRTMKSQTAKEMSKMYGLGTVTSLKTATEAGLIGGSDNSSGGWKTKIGLIPRSHKGAVIMEEFSGGGREFISRLTEIRSSNRVRITRVNSTLDVPAMVRMLSISNPATNGGISLSLNQYPSGIKVLLDLIGASEDIARYDFFLLVDEPKDYISPLDMFDLEPFEQDAYRQRIRWVWSRTADQVTLDRPVAEYIVKKSTELNKAYDSHIKLFGAEAWKKVSRVAIAVAGMLVSTDDEFEKIIVTNEHVDFAVNFLISLYDNEVFKLREYVEGERRYSGCDEKDIKALQEVYNGNPTVLTQMERETELSQRQLQAVSGMEPKAFNTLTNILARGNFFKWSGEKIIPTQKFRLAMKHMKSPYVERVNERGSEAN